MADRAPFAADRAARLAACSAANRQLFRRSATHRQTMPMKKAANNSPQASASNCTATSTSDAPSQTAPMASGPPLAWPGADRYPLSA